MNGGSLVVVLLSVAIALGLFLLFRRVVLWYWGISAILSHLDTLVAQNTQLVALLAERAQSRPGIPPAPPAPSIE